MFVPCLIRSGRGAERPSATLGHPLIDAYLEFVAGRSRANTLWATAYDLKAFFGGCLQGPDRGDNRRCVRVRHRSARRPGS